MKRFGFFISLLIASSFFLSGCGGSSTVVDEGTPQSIAINKIKAYAEDQTQDIPAVEDYVAAGIEGVTTDNLVAINALVATLEPEDVDTEDKIQAILDDNGLTIVDPDDTEAPVIRVTEGATTVTLGETYTDAGATATDNVDTTVTVITVGADFDTSVLGDHTITYTATDAAGNTATATRTVTVIEAVVDDTEAPVITVTEGATTVTLGETYTDAGATATDNVDTTVTVITVGADFDTSVLGDHTITYTATDAAGNTATATRTVTVIEAVVDDTEAPVITVTEGATTVTLGETYTDAGATATDNVDTTVTVITVGADFDTSVLGDHTITYTATDAAGNTATATRTVTVIEAVVEIGDADATNVNTTVVANPLILPVNSDTNITVTLADSNGNLLTTGGDTVTLTASKANSTGTITGPIDNLNGTYTFYATQSVVKSDIRYIATVNGVEVVNQSAVVAFIEATVGEANTTTSVVDATTPVVANGTAATTITVTLKDSNGVSLITGGANVTIGGTGSSTISAVTDNSNGTYTATATNTVSETVTYTASLNGEVITDTASVEFTDATAPDITNPATTVVAVPTEVVADGTTTTITVTLVDGTGAPTTGGEAVTLTSSSASSVPSAAIDNSDGTYTFTASNTVAETVTYTAVLNDVKSTNTATVGFIAGAADATTSTVTASPTEVLNDGAALATITVTLADANGNLLTTGGDTVTMNADSGTVVIDSTDADNGDGTYTFTATNTVLETVTFTGVLGATNITDKAEVLFTDNPASIVPADYVGNTVEFTGVAGEFSFYKNNKFVKVNSTTSEFEFIGTWDTGAIYDDKGVLIDVVSVQSQEAIYHYPMVNGKNTKGPEEVQGFALREKRDTRIEFIHFSDPAPVEPNPLFIWMYGYDSIALTSQDGHGKGTWEAVDGKIVASNPDSSEIQTYAFDRGSVPGSIVTVTNDNNLLKVIVIDDFYELHPSTDLESPIATPVAVDGTAFDGKMMTINSRVRGPASRYFEPREVNASMPSGYNDGIIWAVGITPEGIAWGGKGDHWYPKDDYLYVKVHYDGALGTPERLDFDNSTPVNGTAMSRYQESVRNSGNYDVYLGTSTLDQVSDF